MKARFVRPSDVLDDAATVVVRGGRLEPDLLRRDSARMHEIYGIFGLSVFALRNASLDELAQQSPLVRFAQLTLVTVRALRAAGLSLEPTGRNPNHFTVVLPYLDNGVDALISCEHRTVDNPYHQA